MEEENQCNGLSNFAEIERLQEQDLLNIQNQGFSDNSIIEDKSYTIIEFPDEKDLGF